MRIIKSLKLAMTLLLTTALSPAFAAFPDRPVKIVVTSAPGGFPDSLARLLAERMAKSLGQSVVVDNRAGASGMIGAEFVAKSAADGYTVMVGTVDTLIVNPLSFPHVPFDADKDFAPVGMIVSLPLVVASSATSPDKADSFKDLLSKARQAPGKFSYATWGDGSSGHLAMEMINTPLKMGMLHIPYKGTGPAVNDVVAGVVGTTLVAVQTGEPFFKAGRMRPLAVTSKTRLPALPDVPTVAESGLPGYDVGLWYSMMAPRGTPADVIAKLNTALRFAMDETGFKARMSVSSAPIIGGSPEDARRFIDKDKGKWQAASKSLNVLKKP